MRSLARLAQRTYDLVILGGGITGACVARDAALRGLRVALVEKHDFCSATSGASSKLIHGGLRYLKNFEFGLVRESLRERRLWELHAPHLVYPLPMLLPVYAGAVNSLAEMRVGLTLYDLLAWDRNRLPDPDQRLPAHRALSPAEVLETEPSLSAEGLKGGALLWDCQMFSPERLELECLLSAAAAGAEVVNYAEAVGFVREGARVVGAKIEGRLPGDGFVELRAPVVVNATGPWADLMLETLGQPPHAHLVRSKGIHIITRKLTREVALMMAAGTGHFFVLPWRDHALIGTTDEVYAGHPDAFRVTEADIAGLLATVNQYYPAAELRREDVLHSYGGMRPLVDDDSPKSGSYQKSRRAEVCDHGKTDGVPGLISAIGGKWTTSRALAEKVVDLALRLLGRPRAASLTDRTPLPGGAIGNFRAFVAGLQARHPSLPESLMVHLGRNYGARAGELLALIQADPTLGAPLRPGLPEVGAEIVHAARAEWAVELGDAVLRRTGLGQLGDPGLRALEAAARLMSGPRGWDRAEQVRQVDRVLDRYDAPT
ncbi:glycerol-3-phosphate dehydrogenase [Nannocystis exedens]|uniref:Glycerol-3-phosphate dehydrogenase n=1 Tax=Nannocystis exedens TaxID=54 RepID=A0A1I1X7F4_9BACT|nr:glycerol-3-phosphate dehydrogenase/oxidase [Nannocystis exedens]PCC70762.1 Aerobic glycerol-3-phosphate dehydrogenase [Nannocystis exedens]SFE03346.1 glycerol-3-phosphate dehydrogenase [Nannocystis exedens]